MLRAVIYCRVSTKEQTKNSSLPVQEKACREYCEREGHEVAALFVDEGESAKTIDRPKFKQLLAFCRDKKNRVSVVVVNSIKPIRS
jgi:DNA invertase Pin-like site-specific DNA recombinase